MTDLEEPIDPRENLTIEEELASLEDSEPEYAEPDADDADPNEPGLSGGELVAGEGVSLEQVLDTIFDILYTHSIQLAALGESVLGQQMATAPEVPKLTVVSNSE